MERVLVTGVTGKSGLAFLQELLKNSEDLKDYSFRFIVRNPDKLKTYELDKLNCHILTGSLDDEAFIEKTFNEGQFTTVLHIAGIARTLRLIPAAVKTNVKRLILVHTTGIYSKYKAAGEMYRNIEAEVERLLKGTDISLSILRPTMIYGNMQDNNVSTFIRMVNKLRFFPTISGAKYALQPVWCGDLGKAYYQVLTNPDATRNKNYNLSGAEPILLIEMLRTIEHYLGVKRHYFSVPFPIAYAGAWGLYLITFGKKDYREKVQRMVEERTFSHAEATKDFGYAPLAFKDGVKFQIEEFLDNK